MSLTLTFFLATAVVALLVIGGLCAGLETALSVTSNAGLYRLAEGNSRVDRTLRKIAEDVPGHLSSLQFARILSHTLIAVFATIIIWEHLFESWLAVIIAGLVVSALSFTLLAAVPRNIGYNHPERVLRGAVLLARLVFYAFAPVAMSLVRLTDTAPALDESAQEVTETDDERLLSLVDRAAERNLLEEDDREYIHSLVEFGGTLVRELGVPRTDMVTCEADSTVAEVLDMMLESRHSRLPVLAEDGEDIAGIVYLRDIAGFAHRHPAEVEGEKAVNLAKPAVFVPDLMRGDELLRQMRDNANHLAIMVDEYGGISGLVTMEDLLEELIGDISDEHDRDVKDVVEIESGGYSVSPRLSLDELGELFEIELEDESVDTAAGLFTKELGRLAQLGDEVTVAGIRLTAESVNRRNNIERITAHWVGSNSEEEDGR